VGLNVTETVQLEPAARELPQVVDDAAKSPLALMLSIKMSDGPLFVNVTFLGALVVPTA
jgi:hypothetical protein